MKSPHCVTFPLSKCFSVILAALLSWATVSPAQSESGVEGITLSDPNLKVALLDSHPNEFFLSHDMDLQGRLFLGGREAVFVYAPAEDGGFQERRELYRFPKDTWIYNLEVFGDELLILTNTALYRMRDPLGSNGGKPKPEKILWGNPLGHHHQGLHGMALAPDGALLLSMGDPHPGVHFDRKKPDHFWMWTWYVGPENRPVPYAGVGAVMRLDLETYDLSVYGSGLRNACDLSFDRDWNLFANDNDQEGSTATPCRIVYVPPHSWNGWPRGWDTSLSPARLDLLPNVNWEIDVPTGQGFYDDTVLGEKYRGSLIMTNWGNRSLSYHPIESRGAGFQAELIPLLQADGIRRPVSAMTTNDGRMITSLCYMQGNEASPQSRTDLVMISPKNGELRDSNLAKTPLVDLLSHPLQIRAKAHQEILRRGGEELTAAAQAFATSDPDHPAFSSLIFLAAKKADDRSVARIAELAKGDDRAAVLAYRAAATNSAFFAAKMPDPGARSPEVLAAALEWLHASEPEIDYNPTPLAIPLAAHADAFVRQSAAILLGRRLGPKELDRLASDPDPNLRLAGTLATTFRLWESASATRELPKGAQPALEKHLILTHPEGRIDLREKTAELGIYKLRDWWSNPTIQAVHRYSLARLEKGLKDSDSKVAIASATGLFFLDDPKHEEAVSAVLEREGIDFSMEKGGADRVAMKKAMRALRKAKLSTDTEIPEAFRGIDWDGAKAPNALKGNIAKGKELFTQRGCVACHLAPHDGAGGSIGPTMVGIGERFPPSYLVASLLVPNLTVSPNFHPNTITMKDGTVHTGFVESGAAKGQLALRIITGEQIQLSKEDIAKQDASEQSMMPAGLIHTPEEMAHMIAYLRDKKGKKAGASAAPPKADQEGLLRHAMQPLVANPFHFAATKAKFVRVQLVASNNRGQPCIDEIEVFSGDSEKNLALARHGAKPTASSLLKGYPEKHQIEFLNDGIYGNQRSWIPAKETGWAQIELAQTAAIDRVVLSRDRGGNLTGRTPTSFDIMLSENGEDWKTVARVRPPKKGASPKPAPAEPKRVELNLDETGFVPIFDGKTLDGWDHRKGAWELVDGTISCTGKEKTRNWIIWRGGKPSDFVLRLEFKYEAGNSGVQVRSDDQGDHQVFGYQTEIADQAKMGLWHHSLLSKEDPAREARHLMATAGQEVVITADGEKTVKQVSAPEKIVIHSKKQGWNTMEIEARGNVLIQRINGVVFSKVTDDDRRMSRRSGVIALQDHGKGCQVAFRNIRLKEMKPKTGAAIPTEPRATPVMVSRGKPNPQHPNIVVILADDFGFGDTSCNNPDTPIKTPQIDRIAKEGTRFTNAHTPSAVCTPTRYGLLTGRYPWRTYLKKHVLAYYAPALIPEGRTTLASYLKTQGYRTGGFGKWHLGLGWTPLPGDPSNWASHWDTRDQKIGAKQSRGIDHTKPFRDAPTDVGFDTYFGTPSNAGRVPVFIQDNRVVGNPKPTKNGMMTDPELSRDQVDDLYTAKAIAFIEANEKEHPDHPFFVYLPLNAIHGAVQVPKRFEGKTGMTKREDKILWADQSVGRILDALDQMKLTDDTLLIFTTDNGPLKSPTAIAKGHVGSGPYRGYKTGAWEGGTRVPFLARWPEKIPADTTSNHLIGLVDLLASFAELCGQPLSEGAGPDSVSRLAVLLSDKEKITPRPAMVTATYRGLYAIRKDHWKAIFGTKWSGGHSNANYGGLGADKLMDDPATGQLFHLTDDPAEQNDLWDTKPEIVEMLRKEFERIQKVAPSDPVLVP